MTSCSVCYWKQLWRWTTSESLTAEELATVLDKKEVIDGLRDGITSYKPLKTEEFPKLQSKHSDQTRLLSVVQTLQGYIDVDCFQIWEIIKYYLCDISYGTPENALKNVAFVDTRPSYLLPTVWNFYYAERLYLLKLLQYIVQFKDDKNHKYQQQFSKIITSIGVGSIKTSLISQFEKVLAIAPPPRKIMNDFVSETIRQEWAESNLREQLAILQVLLLLASENPFSDMEFKKLFGLFRKHDFGKMQSYNNLLEERHREPCLRIMNMEMYIFMVTLDEKKISNLSSWIENTKEAVEYELTKLNLGQENSAMLISWMLLTLKSDQHKKMFENHYQHFGATALKMKVFEFLHHVLNSSVFSDKSKCAQVARQHTFRLLNELCDIFDGDGTLSNQPGIMKLCSELLQSPQLAAEFWQLHQKEEQNGVVSLWNTALEYFPMHFSPLSTLAAGLAQGGSSSVRNLIGELKNLPVYTEIYNPEAVPISSLDCDDAVIGRDYLPLGDETYRIKAGSRATVLERKEGTTIHFRTPYSYWTIFNSEVKKVLDQKHHHYNINVALERVYEGAKVLNGVLKTMIQEKVIPKNLGTPCEGVFDVLVRFMRAEPPPLALLVECVQVCTALIFVFPKEVHSKLINTGLLPRIVNHKLTHVEYANGAAFDSAAVGSYLVNLEQPSGSYQFLNAYIDLLCAFHEASSDDRIIKDIILPGLVLILREVLPNVFGWRYKNTSERRILTKRCAEFLTLVLQQRDCNESVAMLKRTCIYSLLHTENSLELLKIISIGNIQLERRIHDETNWISGTGSQYISTIQRCVAIVMFALRLKSLVAKKNEVTPLEHLIFAQSKQRESLKVVPRVSGYINHAFNKSLPVLACRLLKRFAEDFQMSLFASLDMTAYQVRVMFLDRLRDKYETIELKVAILDFVATCIGKQPGLTEAFFMMNHVQVKMEEEKNKSKNTSLKTIAEEADDSYEGILGYMADYLQTVKDDSQTLQSPLLGCIMGLFHALWKNNMQILVKTLRENSKFWEYMTSPLFNDIQPGLKTYTQIFNVLGIELFTSRDKIDTPLKNMLEQFFDVNESHLDRWINFIYSFEGRNDEEILVDKVPIWLGLLTSWKDFTTIICKCLPINLNIAHKSKMVAPCMNALLKELDDMKDSRVVVILAELYVIMLANWKDDCFDIRKTSAKQIETMLASAAASYEFLHPRALRAILSIGTVAISSLDYEIKANSVTAQSIIRSVTNINSLELEKLFNYIQEDKKIEPQEPGHHEEIPPVVLSLAMLEQCLELYDDVFSGLSQWFQSSRFINKLLCCLQICLQNRRHYQTSLAALRCLTAYARGPFSKDLLLSDVDQFLWMPLLPPKIESEGSNAWKPHEWWKVYSYSLDFITMMLMKHGQFFASDAITFVGVHLEHLIEAVLMPRHVQSIDALNLCACTLNLVVQLVQFEARWRIQNINSLVGIMRSISACLYQCVTMMLRARRSSDPALHATDEFMAQPPVMQRTLEILHMATLCLLSFSPGLLPLLADPGLDLERWQPLVELHFGAPKISHEPYPQLTFGTLLTAICILTRSLNHTYHTDEGSGSRSPRGRRRACSCGSPGDSRRVHRSESVTSVSSATSAALWPNDRLVAGVVQATATLLASQALLAVRDPNVASRHKQLIRRELSSELAPFHDFVRKRILCAAHIRPHLIRNKLGAWPLAADETELKMIEEARRDKNKNQDGNEDSDDRSAPKPPPPKRASQDSMREYILRKHYLDKCAQTPTKGPPSPVSHSTPADKKKEAPRSSKRVSWAETTQDSEELDQSMEQTEPVYSNLTDVQINNDEDYFHFLSVVFLYICQTEL